MHLQQNHVDKVYVLCEKLLMKYSQLISSEDMNITNAAAKDHVIRKLKANQSTFKRRNNIRKSTLYVAPKAIPIGLKWKSDVQPGRDIVNHKLTQTKFQYVSMIQTLIAAFQDTEFAKMYFEYNEQSKHECEDNVHRDVCCGSSFKKINRLEQKNVLQIQIGIDDFEPCNALKSKAGVHKLCGVYFQLRNIPQDYRSKLSNIYLLAIVQLSDMNDKKVFDEVYGCIIKEIKFLESNGLSLSSNVTLKGTLVNISFDNLGGNFVFGFTESFNSNYCCRICECDKNDRNNQARENPEKLRTKGKYLDYIKLIEENENFDLLQTKGKISYIR